MAIDFTEFDKPELIEALNIFNEMNLLPSMEEYLIRKMNSSCFNRLTDERNSIVLKLQPLLDKKRKSYKEKAQINRLVKQIDTKTKSREKALKRLLELGMVSDEKYKTLTLLDK